MDYKEAWVVEYSYDQKTFHVDRLNDSVERNLTEWLENGRTSFIPLLVVETSEDAHKFQKAMDCRADRSQPLTNAHVGTIVELLRAHYGLDTR